MSKQNMELIKNFMNEVWNKGNLAFVDQYFTENPNIHFLPPHLPQGREGFKGFAARNRGGVPDMHLQLKDIITDADKVVARWEMNGTHAGDLMGVPASGKPVRMAGLSMFRVDDGKIAEIWSESDDLGLLVQIGAVSPPGKS